MSQTSTAQGSMFEALFTRALKPTGAFADELRVTGYDPQHPQPQYPTQIWVACLAVARRHAFAQLDEAGAYRAMGKRFTESFLDTLAGKVVAVALPFLRPESFLKRLPRYLTMGRSDVTWEVRLEEKGHLVAGMRDPFAVPPDFLGGIIETALALLRTKPTVQIAPRNAIESEFDVRW